MVQGRRLWLTGAIVAFGVLACWQVANMPASAGLDDAVLVTTGRLSHRAFAWLACAHYGIGLLGGAVLASVLAGGVVPLNKPARVGIWVLFCTMLGIAILLTGDGFLYLSALGIMAGAAWDMTGYPGLVHETGNEA